MGGRRLGGVRIVFPTPRKPPRYGFPRMSSTTLLTNALVLAILAPDQARADRAIALAESIGAGCTAKQIATAKRNASKLAAK